MNDKKKALNNLKSDIDILNKLDKWINNVNFFEISGMTNQEIKHSQTLSWFFDANENHSLNDEFIKRFIKRVIDMNADNVEGIDDFDKNITDYNSFTLKREWKHIDILISSDELKKVVAIENKVYATESDGQLDRYHKVIKDEFKDYDKLFIYLTREGEEPSDPDNWCIADYKMIIDSLEESLELSNETINQKTKIIIEDYISMIRRNFGMDHELKRTAQQIYLKHKKAFDLIFEVATTGHTQFADYIKNWLEENQKKYKINFNSDYSTNSIIRFTTPFIDKLFPFDEEKSDAWGYGYSFMYEILVSKNRIHIEGVLANPSRPNSQKLIDFVGSSTRVTKWRRIMTAKPILSEEYIVQGLTDEVMDKLDFTLSRAITGYVNTFEIVLKDSIK